MYSIKEHLIKGKSGARPYLAHLQVNEHAIKRV